MPSENYDIIRQAILAKKNISADYNGYKRIMTPHTLGHKDGREHCLCYQFDGESSSGISFTPNSPDNWRCIFVSKLQNVVAIDGAPHTSNQHSERQTCVDRVDVELAH